MVHCARISKISNATPCGRQHINHLQRRLRGSTEDANTHGGADPRVPPSTSALTSTRPDGTYPEHSYGVRVVNCAGVIRPAVCGVRSAGGAHRLSSTSVCGL